jgi:S-adenosyl-L-methionine hydrolase (adenosine-forming)
MSRISPQSPIVDLSHLVRPLNVTAGALLLADSLPYLAPEAVVVAIVDPNVGKDRDIAVEAEGGRRLVGPDNGLLALAWNALGGIRRAVEITSDSVILQPVSPSLHARDVLCPAAAHLAAGMDLGELGQPLEPASLESLSIPEPEVEPGRIRCEVLDLNRFGNIQLNVREEHLAAAGLEQQSDLGVEATSTSVHARQGTTYADFEVGEYGVMFDPRGWLEIVRGNPASAFEGLGLQIGDPVWLSSPESMSERLTS